MFSFQRNLKELSLFHPVLWKQTIPGEGAVCRVDLLHHASRCHFQVGEWVRTLEASWGHHRAFWHALEPTNTKARVSEALARLAWSVKAKCLTTAVGVSVRSTSPDVIAESFAGFRKTKWLIFNEWGQAPHPLFKNASVCQRAPVIEWVGLMDCLWLREVCG